MSSEDAVVIGAGPAGLATAAELGRLGVRPVVVERSDTIGSSWRGRYDRLRLNTSRWTSHLPGTRYPRGTGMFPTRDQMIDHLEAYAQEHELDIRFGTEVARIERDGENWTVRATPGDFRAAHVVVATGHQHTPRVADWPGRESFGGVLMHAAEYRNPERFRDQDVLVVGPGCSGMEIAYDLVEGGAGRVWLAVRTPPNLVLRTAGPFPGEFAAMATMLLPTRIADAQMRVVRRLDVGNLAPYGLPRPDIGPVHRLKTEGKAPAIVDKPAISAIKDGRIEIVAGVESLDETGAVLSDGKRVECAAVIAAVGYDTGLERLVGHLGVLDGRGVPRVHEGREALPGLRFVGYKHLPGQIGRMGREARRAAREVARARPATAVAV